jgi:hypothetical protein
MLQAIKGSRRIVIAGQGEFCLYFNEDANGGYYHFDGSDPNLDNDRYEGGDTGEIVGDTARYAFNAGGPGSQGRCRRLRPARLQGCGRLHPSRYVGHAAQELVEQHRVLPLGDEQGVRGRGPDFIGQLSAGWLPCARRNGSAGRQRLRRRWLGSGWAGLASGVVDRLLHSLGDPLGR